MANRVTAAEVLAIMDTNDIDSSGVYPFIVAANIVITDKLAGQSLGEDLLKECERWLAAHFAVVLDPSTNIQTEKTGATQATYFGKSGLGLDGSVYGQRLRLLDTSGILSELGMKEARVDVLDIESD